MKTTIRTMLLFLVFALPARAYTTFDFLEIGFGAASSGLGQAAVAESGSLEGVWHNPATLAALTGPGFSGSVNPYLGMTLWSAAASLKPSSHVTLAASGCGLAIEGITGDILYNGDPGRSIRTGITSGGISAAFALGAAAKWPFRLDLGIKGKIVTETLDQTPLSAFLLNAGLALAFPGAFAREGSLQFGFIARNIGRGGVPGQPDVIPLSLLVGTAYVLPLGKKVALKALVDGDLTVADQTMRLSTGVEAFLFQFLTARAGYLFDNAQSARGLSLGAGIQFPIAHFDGHLDYALQPLEGLGVQQHFQLTLAWNPNK
ncbi:MAG: hypothetical protein J0L75_19745 [Spirochaetes bacterium]|nr:hypothetical protein [Spirochaetota bacterium]